MMTRNNHNSFVLFKIHSTVIIMLIYAAISLLLLLLLFSSCIVVDGAQQQQLQLQQQQQQQQQLQKQQQRPKSIQSVGKLGGLAGLLTRKANKILQKQDIEDAKVSELRARGFHDQVGHSPEAALLRSHMLRKKKRKAAARSAYSSWFSNHNNNNDIDNRSMMNILFPGMKPELYKVNETMYMITDQVRSRKTHVPYEFYDTIPGCPMNIQFNKHMKRTKKRHYRKNLGSKLQGSDLLPAPYVLNSIQNIGCTSICSTNLDISNIRKIRKLIERQYRIYLLLDQLPVLMRNTELNYIVRGYPIGFKAPSSYTGLDHDEYYLYNHLKFIITYEKVYSSKKKQIVTTTAAAAKIDYQRRRRLNDEENEIENENNEDEDSEEEDEEELDISAQYSDGMKQPTQQQLTNEDDDVSDLLGIYITGFDVYPVSIEHAADGSTCTAQTKNIINDPNTYLTLRGSNGGTNLNVQYSYEVQWIESQLPWEDRWDVYLIGTPDDDIHFFAIINSLMIVLFLTGAIATIMIRTLRKDIMTYNSSIALLGKTMDDSSDRSNQEETGWKLVHSDVFRPPSTDQYPMALCCFVGTGTQLGCAALMTLLLSLIKVVNPINKGQTLTAILILYVLSGSVNGYVSARLYKYCEKAKHWKMNTLCTAVALPGIFLGIFTTLNTFLSIEGAATAVSFVTLLTIFAMWIFLSTPLVLVGSYYGYKKDRISVPTQTNQIHRVIPTSGLPWYIQPPVSFLLGGLLPFGSVCIELFFIMSALWLHQIYYVMGFLLAVLLILAATCAQVSIVMDYLQLCAEDYHWWWKSFGNCASAGFYLFLYSLWFLVNRLELVGFLSVVIYLTYMAMISLCFSLFCGSVGFICAFWFNRTIYGALNKVD